MQNIKNENAVSPVIGVILMVVITVIIAAILAVFAFGMGAPAKAPQTQLKYTAVSAATTGTTDIFTIANTGGDSLVLTNEQITVFDVVTPATVMYSGVLLSTLPSAPATKTLAPGSSFQDVAPGVAFTKGEILEIQVLDVPTGQMISDTKITVQ